MDKSALYARDLDDDLVYRTSSFSEDTAVEVCVEVAKWPDGAVALRDSQNRALAPLRFTPEEWAAFTAGVRAGEFD